jgi:hypothetical protein
VCQCAMQVTDIGCTRLLAGCQRTRPDVDASKVDGRDLVVGNKVLGSRFRPVCRCARISKRSKEGSLLEVGLPRQAPPAVATCVAAALPLLLKGRSLQSRITAAQALLAATAAALAVTRTATLSLTA